jgi:hypothetical protein
MGNAHSDKVWADVVDWTGLGTDGVTTQFLEHVPLIGYGVAIGQSIAGHQAEAQRAAARCTNETVKGVMIAGAVALTPFEGPFAPFVWMAAGAAGDLMGAGIQAAIEEAYPKDVEDIIGKETQDEWNKDIAGTFFIHAGVGAVEGLVTGGVGFIVDGVYPAASAELAEITTVGEVGEGGELINSSWTGVGARNDPVNALGMTRQQRAAGINVARGGVTRVTRRQAITFIAKKPGNFITAYKAGVASVKETLTTRRGIARYIIKKLGNAFVSATIFDAPRKTLGPGRRGLAASNDDDDDSEPTRLNPLFMHVQGSISRKGIPGVLGHMHIATTELEDGDSRTGQSSFAYVTHSPTERALLYTEESAAGDGFHIRVSSSSGRTAKDRYLAVANGDPKDLRDANSLYVNAHDGYPGATWALEIYEDVHAVLRLVRAGTVSGRSMIGGYLIAHFDQERDRRKDGGAYLAVSNDPGTDVASIFGFRFMSPDQLWWMDVVGDYECHLYDDSKNHKNGYHYVTVAESIDHQGLYWMNQEKVFWRLTPQVGGRDTLLTQNDCVYFDHGHKECKVLYDSDQNVVALLGPSNERYDRVWWRDLEGMLFECNDFDDTDKKSDGDYVRIEKGEKNQQVVLVYRSGRSLVVKGDYKDRSILSAVDNSETRATDVTILRNSFGLVIGLVTVTTVLVLGLSNASEVIRTNDGISMTFMDPITRQEDQKYEKVSKVFLRYSLTELLGRYVTQVFDDNKKRTVSTYMSVHGSLKEGKNEVWWQSTNGETWSLQHAARDKLIVGETCPYLKDGYTMCTITRNSDGVVESLAGPNGRTFTRI